MNRLWIVALVACGPASQGVEERTTEEAPVAETAWPVAEVAPTMEAAPAATGSGPPLSGTDSDRCRGFALTAHEAGCPPQAQGDCESGLTLAVDGTLTLDPWGAPGVSGLRAQLTPEQMRTACETLAAPALQRELGSCAGADASEHMRIEIGNGPFEGDTGACNTDPVMAARGTAIHLVHEHFPDRHLVSPPF